MADKVVLMREAGGLDLSQVRKVLARDGVVSLNDDAGLFTTDEWALLEDGAVHPGLPYEHVLIGDAGEPNLVEVGRLMTDVDRPRIANADQARPMLEVLGSRDRLVLLAELIGSGQVYMRRAQINRMHAGSFIGLHLDQDSNPDYTVAIVLQMGTKFDGGEFVVHPPHGATVTVKPKYRSITISRCDYPHEVRRVGSGIRTSLVYFVADHDSANRRRSFAATTSA